MNKVNLSIPELALVAATRGMAGVGIGLLIADLLRSETRKAVGWTLLTVGVITTVPIAIEVFSQHRREQPAGDDYGG
jgi:hypothetical protein